MGKDEKLLNILTSALAHSQMLLLAMDELKEYPFFRHEFKQLSNRYDRELESLLEEAHKNAEDQESSEKWNEYFDQYRKILGEMDRLTIDERGILSEKFSGIVDCVKGGKKIMLKMVS